MTLKTSMLAVVLALASSASALAQSGTLKIVSSLPRTGSANAQTGPSSHRGRG